MKNKLLICLLALCLVPSLAAAQSKGFDKIFAEFEEIKGVESVSISPKIFASYVTGANKTKEAELFAKMNMLKILSVSGSNNSKTINSLNTKIFSLVERERFEQVMRVREDGETLVMYQKESELLFLANSKNECSVIYISGTIDQELMKAVLSGEISIQ